MLNSQKDSSPSPFSIEDCIGIINNALEVMSTPMQSYLTNNNVPYKECESIYLDNVTDGNFYRVVSINPNDTIDKINLFNKNFNNVGQNVFSVNDFKPLSNETSLTYNEILNYQIPSS
jgi:hypothetical protein